MNMEPGLVMRRLRAEEVPIAHELEALSYPAVRSKVHTCVLCA